MTTLQRPKPKNFYEVGDVQVRVFDNAVTLWIQMGNAWVKRTIQMRKLAGDNDKPMVDSYELINTQGTMTHAAVERKHMSDEVLAKLDGTVKKAHALWLLHDK